MESKHNPLAPPTKYYHGNDFKYSKMLDYLTPTEWLRLNKLFEEEYTHVIDLILPLKNDKLTFEVIE